LTIAGLFTTTCYNFIGQSHICSCKVKKSYSYGGAHFLYWVDIVFQLVHQSWCVALKNTCRYMAERGARWQQTSFPSGPQHTGSSREEVLVRPALPPARACNLIFKSKERTLGALTLIHTLLSDMCVHHGAVTPTHTQC
jgi:hypothetical protein